MQYFDVGDITELPAPPKDFRYLDFISGPKGRRCFLVSRNMPRGEFLEQYSHLLDERLHPIYQNEGITVRQDASYPIPGFYVVHPKTEERSMDEMDEILHLRTAFVIREIRKGMRQALGIEHLHLYYEEKRQRKYDIHFWILPIYNFRLERDYIGSFLLRDYLDSFEFEREKEKILQCNHAIKDYLQESQLLSRDNQLREILTHKFS